MSDFVLAATALVFLCFLLRELSDPWAFISWFVSRERVRDYLIKRAMRTPYSHLPGYMDRYWLFNAYDKVNGNEVTPIKWLPSIRIHHILRRDDDRHMHDHPWDARTIILDGHYIERRLGQEGIFLIRKRGDTASLKFGEYHTITYVPDGGVWTLFITFGYKGTWGFLVDGKKVQWRDYLDIKPDGPWSNQEKPQ